MCIVREEVFAKGNRVRVNGNVVDKAEVQNANALRKHWGVETTQIASRKEEEVTRTNQHETA
jgi:hypothetical protein